jgi:hypothetical protein
MENADIAGATDAAHQLVAVYESEAEAEAAKRALIAAGVNPFDIEVFRAAPADVLARDEVDPIVNKSFWGRLRELLVIAPSHEIHALEEGLTRGHAILTLSPPPIDRDKMIALLEGTGPLDFNAKQQQWRESGWEPEHAGLKGFNAPDLTVVAGDGGRIRSYRPTPAAGDPSI